MITRLLFLVAGLLLIACGGTDTKPAPAADATKPTAVADSVIPDVEDREPLPDDNDDAGTAGDDAGDVPDADAEVDEDDDLAASADDKSGNARTPSARANRSKGSKGKELGLITIPANRPPDNTPDPAPNEFVSVTFEAAPLNATAVRNYINSLNKSGLKGKVYLKVLVDLEGYYSRHVVRQSPDERLTEYVVAGLKRMKWSPANNSGEPVKVWVAFSHSFE